MSPNPHPPQKSNGLYLNNINEKILDSVWFKRAVQLSCNMNAKSWNTYTNTSANYKVNMIALGMI